MAAPLMHSVTIDAKPDKIYEAISTGAGLASFWTSDSKAEPRVGSVANFGFGGPTQRMKVDELSPAKRLIRAAWPTAGPVSEQAGQVFPQLQEIITALRNLRNQHKVDPKRTITVSMSGPFAAGRNLIPHGSTFHGVAPGPG